MTAESLHTAGIDQLITQLAGLRLLLQEEFDSIRQRELEQLEALAQKKQSLVNDINQSVANIGGDLQTLLNDKSSASARQLAEHIQACAQANKTNGCAIQSSHSFTAALLDVLRGRTPGERTYTARGRLGASLGSSAGAFVRV